ncbi:MAG: LPXTG cell wall anchor domain-containing protein [Oscillospiraceae bacterium]|nr:LPXTG cell wall anchor domain-containing protein [Oscillospiraceae bacterium]
MKRLLSIALSLLLLLALCVPASAAATPVVTYDGSAQLSYTDESGSALSGSGDFGTAFTNMLPGATYSQSIVLKNTSASDTVRFYMSLGVLETLKAAKLDGAGYTVTLTSQNQTLYSSINGEISGTLVGGSGSTGELKDLNAALYSTDGKGILVSTLAPGASDTLTLSITADATMSDAYQSASGTLEFQFFAEVTASNGKITKVYVPGKTIYNTVKTGESGLIFAAAGVLLLAVITLLIVGRKKDHRKNPQENG